MQSADVRSTARATDCVAGSVTDITWKGVRVGQIVQVNDNELFPADLLCLYSALPDR